MGMEPGPEEKFEQRLKLLGVMLFLIGALGTIVQITYLAINGWPT